MKLTKNDLKTIVKECLVEILNEGVGVSSRQQPSTRLPASTNNQSVSQLSKRHLVSPAHNRLPQPSQSLREAIKRESGGNSVMEAILADTASSTLPTFLQNDGKTQQISSTAGGGLAEQVVANANPEDLFGDEATSKWASLAFMDSPIKK
jgi:hypothetical protein